MTISSLERLAVLVVATVGIVFMYGMLSMAWAEDASRPYNVTSPWILWVKVGSRPVEAKNAGNFDTKEQCKYVAKLVIRDIRRTDKTSHLEVNCELREQT